MELNRPKIAKILNKKGILPLVLALIVGFIYIKLLNGFFQQDEWFSFTFFILNKSSFAEVLKFFFAPNIGHYNPLTGISQHILFSLWGMNYSGFAVLGILLHLLIVVSVFLFGKIIFNGNKLLAFLVALLFGVWASAYQAVSWVVADISTLSASLFGVISSILFFNFLKKKGKRYLFWSLVTLGVSLLFKEITVGLFPFFFTVALLNKEDKKRWKNALWVGAVGGFYVLARILMFFVPNVDNTSFVSESTPLIKFAYNFITLPLKTLSQTVFPAEFIKEIAIKIALLLPERLTGTFGTPAFEVFVVKRIMEGSSLLVSILILGLSLMASLKKKDNQFKNITIYALGWILLNSLIFSFAPEQPNVIFVVDSRNLYFVAVGVAILVVTLLQRKLILLVIPFLVFNIYYLNRNLDQIVERGKIRKYILNKVEGDYPNIPLKTVFYTESDTSYYGLADKEKILPFQSGFGQTLLVWYYEKENFPAEFYKNRYLWEITDQGYKESANRGFGYFRDFKLLEKTMEAYNLTKDSVIAFRWNSRSESLTDITEETRKKL